MDLSPNDVLFLLGAVELAACAGCALYWLLGRGSEARKPARRGRGGTRPEPPRRRAARERHAGPEPLTPTPAAPAPAPAPAASVPAESVRVESAPVESAPIVIVAARDELADTGRHHVPEELLHSVTYRLSADLRARAKVPGATSGPSYQIPGRGRTSDDVPLPA